MEAHESDCAMAVNFRHGCTCGGEKFAHMCQNGHPRIGHSISDYEPEELACPVCRERAAVDARVKEAVEDADKVWRARLAEAEGYISALVEGKAKAEALREDGIPVCYLRAYVKEAEDRVLDECCKVVCISCRAGLPMVMVGPGDKRHFDEEINTTPVCHATALRAKAGKG